MPSLQSVNSNITSNTFNTVGTGDRTVQAGNTLSQRTRRVLFKSRSASRIDENATSDSSSIAKSSTSAGSTTSEEIKHDLSGGMSNEEMRKQMDQTIKDIDTTTAKTETTNDMSSWFSTIFCNADTTTNDTNDDSGTLATMEKTDSESSMHSEENQTVQLPAKNQSISLIMSNVGKKRLKKGNKKAQLKSNHNLDRHSSFATDAAFLSSALKDAASPSYKKSPKSPKSAKSKYLSASPHSPPSPTRLKEGAGSLDIVMELQCDEDLMIGNGAKGSRKKGVFRKRMKNTNSHKGIQLQDKQNVKKSMNSSANRKSDAESVVSERSIFSFASETNNTTSRTNGVGKAVSITGPANGTFLNITSEDNTEISELADTYDRFRVDARSVEMVLNRFATSIPLYHWQGKYSSSSLNNVRSEDLGLGTFSDLGLTSPSMKGSSDALDIPADLRNVCSEPSAKGFNVRSSSYLKDGAKAPSGETMFSLLGADNIIKTNTDGESRSYDVSKSPSSYFAKLTGASKALGLKTPFLIVVNFVVPWGNFISYYYRPDATNGGPFCDSRKSHASEKLWKAFMEGGDAFRNNTLKFIPKILVGPWALKKLVGTQPAMIGQKIPTKYFGSVEEGYIEICMDVTKGGKMANSICSAVASKASAVSIDLAFLLQGTNTKELPEQLLTVVRLHHVSLKKEKQRIEI